MPWRRARPNAYHVWLSEVMLQQTQVDTVRPYFARFIQQFPTICDLAAADSQAVLKAWEGLGYYSRARNLQKAAAQLVESHNGKLPRTAEKLQALPGFGPYISAAVASIAFGEAVPVVDGNVLRVTSRLFGLDDDVRQPATRTKFYKRLLPLVPEDAPGDFNQALMELGALVCRPVARPACETCPLRNDCVARRDDRVAELPVKSARKSVPHHRIAVGVIHRGGKILIGRRRDDQMLGGLWEFPGGKCEAAESPADTVVREVLEETGLTVTTGAEIATVGHAYSHFSITLTALHCKVVSGRTRARSAAELRWVKPGELRAFPFPKANRRVLDALLGLGSGD